MFSFEGKRDNDNRRELCSMDEKREAGYLQREKQEKGKKSFFPVRGEKRGKEQKQCPSRKEQEYRDKNNVHSRRNKNDRTEIMSTLKETKAGKRQYAQ